MSLSLIGRSIKASPTLRINEKAAIMRQKGDPVVHLGGGEPKARTPIEAATAAAALLDAGEVRYTPAEGTPEMKAAIIRYTEEFYGRRVAPENVMASSGAKQAIMVALQAILNPQEEVVFPAPYWVSYPEMVKLCQGVPVPAPPEDGTFQPRIEDIEQRVGSYTKAVIVNSPNNPSGAVYSEQFIADVVEFCEKRGLWLIMDDIYHRLVFRGNTWRSAWDYAKRVDENSKIIIINGVSKAYAMTGFRIGWAIGNRKLIEVMSNIQSHQTSGPSVLLQKAAIAALKGPQTSVEALRMTLENNRDYMLQELRGFDGVHVEEPGGTFYCFADFSNYDPDSTRLAERLLDRVMVATVPGVEFGREGYLRLSYCGSIKDIKQGIERMKWLLDPNAPNELFIGERKLVRQPA